MAYKRPTDTTGLWKRLFRLRNRYHSLEDTLQFEGLRKYWTVYRGDLW